jgi:hydroxymethylpyrimidine pyrophosphatase-like HAD family hydrolase
VAAPNIELVVTDLDGTLWDTPSTTHPDVLSALPIVQQRYPLLVATGRRLRSTREPLAGLGATPPAVVLNGALVVDLVTDERLHRQAFSVDAARDVLAAFTEVGLSPCVYVDDGPVEVFTGPQPDTHPDHLRDLGEWARPADLGTIVTTRPVYAFAMLGQPAEPLEKVADLVADVAACYLSPDREHGGLAINVNPADLSKWVGVEAFCRHADLDPGAVLALGDGTNDVDLLTNAAVSLVPKDGSPAALACADVVIGRAVDGGWAEVLDLL